MGWKEVGCLESFVEEWLAFPIGYSRKNRTSVIKELGLRDAHYTEDRTMRHLKLLGTLVSLVVIFFIATTQSSLGGEDDLKELIALEKNISELSDAQRYSEAI